MASLGGSRSKLGDTLNPATSAIATRTSSTDTHSSRNRNLNLSMSCYGVHSNFQLLNDDRNERVNDDLAESLGNASLDYT